LETRSVTVRPLVQHFSDILCVWAYVANARLEHVAARFGDRVDFELRFCSVFPDARGKLGLSWKDRGGLAGYAEHVRSVARRFDHVEVHPDAWVVAQPRSSTALHQFVKAVEIEDPAASASSVPLAERLGHRAAWALREAFFRDGRDIGQWSVQAEIASGFGLDPPRIESHLRSGAAAAALEADLQLAARQHIAGSPTFVMNEGRQILYGNVGAHLIGANIEEMLRQPEADEASWC